MNRLKVLLSVFIMVFSMGTVFAHEPRLIGGGALNVVVGWQSEPTYVNVMNAFDFRVTDDISIDSIDLSVRALYLKKDAIDAKIKESAILTGTLRRNRSNPNRFNISFLPKKVGAYGFHIVGLINGISVDEVFVCRGGTKNLSGRSFGCVENLQKFPD